VRSFLRWLLGLILRIFFPRIEISNVDRVPARGPVILVVNHPNGLIDPLFLLCLSPRPVSFLAKAPLFDMPVIGWFVKALGSIPVYRRQDEGFDSRKNRQTFDRARAILAGGGVIAIFPEGASHDDPKLRPLKTGAARIALGATAVAGGNDALLTITPMGIYYTAKGIFRSEALLYFGQPITVAPTRLGADGEPPSDEVRQLTDHLEKALSDVTLQADEHEALALVARAEQLFSAEEPASGERLAHQFELRRRFLAGYSALRIQAPERLASLSARIARYEAELSQAGVDRETLLPREVAPVRLLGRFLRTLALSILVLPAALVGAVVNYPAYRLVGFIATGFARGDEGLVATIKILAGALLFPLTWIAVAVTIGLYRGITLGIVALIIAPLSGYVALRLFERLDEFMGGLRALVLSRFRRWGFLRLIAERRAIREEIVQLAEEFEQ
jgi:glycerol-3-phosphate O-acyltransferase / dihydroxyacetone phosphate acyltransferase